MVEQNRELEREKKVGANLEASVEIVRRLFTDTPDLFVRRLTIKQTGEKAALVFLQDMTDRASLNRDILGPLQLEAGSADGEWVTNVAVVRRESVWSVLQEAIFEGDTVLLVDGRSDAFVLDTKGWPQRAIEDPQQEPSLKGAHQGFVETASQNIAMIRRYIPHGQLKMRKFKVGERGNTNVCLLYLQDVANPDIVDKLDKRIREVEVDIIINTGELSEFIEDSPFALFPQTISTERPDTAASQILQGRCVIVVDRSPSVLVAPVNFMAFFQTVDDYSTRWSIATFLRLLRMFAFFAAIFLPGFYIAVLSFHFEIIPMKLLLTLGESRGQVPFPPFVEALLMEITLEMLREAGVRLPSPIGQTVGIVGGIVIGQAVVQAGLISNIMVIVVAFTAIASFIMPNADMTAAVRLMRFFIMIMALLFGFAGLIVGFMILIGRLIGMNSVGTAYSSPFTPLRPSDWKDTLVRVPLRLMNMRPVSNRTKQLRRQSKISDSRKRGST